MGPGSARKLGRGLLEHVEQKFRQSPLWQEYEDLLLAIATAPEPQSAPESTVQGSTPPRNWPDDERVNVQVGQQVPQTLNYTDQFWGMLRALAQAGRLIPNKAPNSKDFVAMGKRMERLRRKLRTHFRIEADPIPLEAEVGYRCQFSIGCSPSFEK
jgi:hypothetical protein